MEDTYYLIHVSYEIPYNVMDSTEIDILKAKGILYSRLKSILPDKYERFGDLRLGLNQLKDTFNYLVTFSTFFRSTEGLPMEEYVSAREVKEEVQRELEDFFDSIDCEYRKINIKTFIDK